MQILAASPALHASDELEAAARMLERSGEYRILRKLGEFSPPAGSPQEFRKAIALDCETTGLDTSSCAVIQISMIKFAYSATGAVCRLIGRFDALQDPGCEIPAEVTALTGIDNEAVRGRSIDVGALAEFASDSALVVAHNASFDRPVCERHWPIFAKKPWACSATEVDWRALGFDSARLGSLCHAMGWFFGAHRADQDTMALVHLLAAVPPGQDVTALSLLLSKARRSSARIWATDAPFASKDRLKARGYKWNPTASGGTPRAWAKDLDPDALDAEIDFLRAEVYRAPISPPVQFLTADTRFSLRQPAVRPIGAQPPLGEVHPP